MRLTEAQRDHREMCDSNPDYVPDPDDSIDAALERDRVDAVLDEYSLAHPQWTVLQGLTKRGLYRWKCGPICEDAASPKAARAAACKAIEALTD